VGRALAPSAWGTGRLLRDGGGGGAKKSLEKRPLFVAPPNLPPRRAPVEPGAPSSLSRRLVEAHPPSRFGQCRFPPQRASRRGQRWRRRPSRARASDPSGRFSSDRASEMRSGQTRSVASSCTLATAALSNRPPSRPAIVAREAGSGVIWPRCDRELSRRRLNVSRRGQFRDLGCTFDDPCPCLSLRGADTVVRH